MASRTGCASITRTLARFTKDADECQTSTGLVMEFLDPAVWKNLGSPPSFDSVTRDVYAAGATRSCAEIAALARVRRRRGRGAARGGRAPRRRCTRTTRCSERKASERPAAKLSDFGAAFFYPPGSALGNRAREDRDARVWRFVGRGARGAHRRRGGRARRRARRRAGGSRGAVRRGEGGETDVRGDRRGGWRREATHMISCMYVRYGMYGTSCTFAFPTQKLASRSSCALVEKSTELVARRHLPRQHGPRRLARRSHSARARLGRAATPRCVPRMTRRPTR